MCPWKRRLKSFLGVIVQLVYKSVSESLWRKQFSKFWQISLSLVMHGHHQTCRCLQPRSQSAGVICLGHADTLMSVWWLLAVFSDSSCLKLWFTFWEKSRFLVWRDCWEVLPLRERERVLLTGIWLWHWKSYFKLSCCWKCKGAEIVMVVGGWRVAYYNLLSW